VNARAVSEEARRHMARGQAAMEMAKSPEDYEAAIREFQEAARLAPDWPDPHYNLGLVQEKSGKFREAIASLNEYLRLAPNAPDAAKVKEQIYKLEYKVEQVLTVPEIIDVLVSLSGQWQQWQEEGQCDYGWGNFDFEREGSDAVKVLKANRYYPRPGREYYQTLKVTGPVLKYIATLNVCSDGVDNYGTSCDAVMEHEVEVVSKRLIKVNQKVLRGGFGAGFGADGKRYTCTFRKK
jgi:tetratricopeptide (TPR) repeat protein